MARQQGMVSGAPRLCDCRLQRPYPPDDRGQLLGAGHLWTGGDRLCGDGVVQADAGQLSSPRRPVASIPLFRARPADRDPPRDPDRAGDAEKGVGSLNLPGGSGAPPAYPLECDRDHLDHLYPAGYRPVRCRDQQPQFAGSTLRSYGNATLRLDHRDADGGLALDPAGCPAGLCGTAGDPRGLLSGSQD